MCKQPIFKLFEAVNVKTENCLIEAKIVSIAAHKSKNNEYFFQYTLESSSSRIPPLYIYNEKNIQPLILQIGDEVSYINQKKTIKCSLCNQEQTIPAQEIIGTITGWKNLKEARVRKKGETTWKYVKIENLTFIGR